VLSAGQDGSAPSERRDRLAEPPLPRTGPGQPPQLCWSLACPEE